MSRRRWWATFYLSSVLPIPIFELLDECIIGANYLTAVLNPIEGILEAHSAILNEIGQDKSDWSRDSSQAVYHEISPFKAVFDEWSGLIEESAQVKSFVVLSRDVEGVRDDMLGMVDFMAFTGCQHCFDAVF